MKITGIENGLEGIGVLKDGISSIQKQVNKLVATVVEKDFPKIAADDIHCPFNHECEKSPFGWCVYNKLDDPAADNCLYCHEPYERK